MQDTIGESRPFTVSARMNRRAILRAAVSAAAVGASGAMLAACGGGSAATTPAATSKPTVAAMPTTAPATAATGATGAATMAATPATSAPATAPMNTMTSGTSASGAAPMVDGKLPSPAEGVPDAYLKAPTPSTSYNGVPGRGGKVVAFTIAYQSPPLPREQNQYWQGLEKRLSVTWEPIITPQPDYGSKSAALIAGGNLPDLFYLNPGQNAAPQYRAMEQGVFLDLTPYVTGDALKEYKNLATFPAYMWDNVKFKGKQYGVPKPLQRNGNIPFYRADWAKKLGKAPPKSTGDVHDLLVAFAKNDPDADGQADTFGMGRYGTDWNAWDNYLRNMWGVPFNWRKNADGTFTHMIETDEYRQTLDWQRQLYADGAYHPDSAGMNFAQAQSLFISGKTGLHTEGIGNFYSPSVPSTVYAKIHQANPQAELAGLLPSAIGGDRAVTYNTQGSFGFVGIPATVGKDKERVRELLRILDYLAAPFGSEEWRFLMYGVEGVDYKLDDKGAPVRTDRGTSEIGDLIYLMGGLPVFYFPLAPEVAPQAQQLAAAIIKIGIDDPTWPLYSPTNVAKAAELNQFGLDRATAIVTGREPFSALDQAIKDWRSRGGDMARKEFEQAAKGQ